MLQWVEQILGPYIKTAPEGIATILALDSYCCHMMASVVHAIQDLGVEVPGGYTGKCQPLDVGVNKTIKKKMKEQWEDWMLLEGLLDGVTKSPPRKLVVMWTISAFGDVTTSNIKNSWRHKGCSWFD